MPLCGLELIRANIGDEKEPYLVSDDLIEYWISTNDNESVVTLKALKYIVTKLTKYVDEKSGLVDVKWSQLLAQYRQLLKDIASNPIYQSNPSGFIFGGTSNTEINRVNSDTESVCAPIKLGFYTEQFNEDWKEKWQKYS